MKSYHYNSLVAPDISDDTTIGHGEEFVPQRIPMMCTVPRNKSGINDEEDPSETIWHMIAMTRNLLNKSSLIKFSPFYYFNIFISPGDQAYI